jgi:hypothetical protein
MHPLARVLSMYSTYNAAAAAGVYCLSRTSVHAGGPLWRGVLEAARGSALLVAVAAVFDALTRGLPAFRALVASVLGIPLPSVPSAASALADAAMHLGPVLLLGAPTAFYGPLLGAGAMLAWYAAVRAGVPGGTSALYSAPGHPVDRAHVEGRVLPAVAAAAAVLSLALLASPVHARKQGLE